MVIDRKSVVRWLIFWGVVGMCIWFLVSRWSDDADPPWADPDQYDDVDHIVDIVEHDEALRDLPVVISAQEFNDNSFSGVRMERERSRSQQLEWLMSIAGDDRVSEQARERAGMQAVELMDAIASEEQLENLIRSKGFTDAIVYLFAEAAVVVVKADHLTETDVICISELIIATAGISREGITIVSQNDI